ncbi:MULTISPECIES: hypothetical protein [unclassified Mesorhizobium]|uniref:hypothetical protein n=1 Tax=unclassified Mesorhizobium TaxID=325217 RepID=UPI001129A11D|nr:MULTISPECIES: hypothetical protein [unclassified Mesorhizobium]TPL42563.1 hypothetical protein FJ961_07690 [Mesorhizobium sp. B2-4-5]TPL66563.1 hypothetical protein FJ949_09350 [Mesorhizobium sp. B2-4-1]
MTPKQKEMLIRGLLTDRLYPSGGEYNTLKSLWMKGWTTDAWHLGRKDITAAGLEALELNSEPIEIIQVGFTELVLVKGQPVARVLDGKRKQMETLLADQSL